MAMTVKEMSAAIAATHGDSMLVRYCPDVLTDAVHHVSMYEKTWDAWGFGDGSDPVVAMTKAYYECIERVAYKHSGAVTTNGFAAHVSFDLAAEKAKAELVERDVFLASWFAQIPPVWLAEQQVEGLIDDWGLECLELLRRSGVVPSFGICGVSNGLVTMAGLLDGRSRPKAPFAFSAIPGIGPTIEGAIRNLILDLMRINTGIEAKGQEVDEFKVRRIDGQIAIGETFDHLDYFLELGNASKMAWYMQRSSTEAPILPDLTMTTAEVPVPIKTAFPLSVAHASSPEAQQYFVGSARQDRINWHRLSNLGVKSGQSVPLVHPIP